MQKETLILFRIIEKGMKDCKTIFFEKASLLMLIGVLGFYLSHAEIVQDNVEQTILESFRDNSSSD